MKQTVSFSVKKKKKTRENCNTGNFISVRMRPPRQLNGVKNYDGKKCFIIKSFGKIMQNGHHDLMAVVLLPLVLPHGILRERLHFRSLDRTCS